MCLFIALVRVVVEFIFISFVFRQTYQMRCELHATKSEGRRVCVCVLVCRQFTDNHYHLPRNWFRKESLEILWKCGTFSNEFYFWIEITVSASSVRGVCVCVWLKRSEVRLLAITRTHTRHIRLNKKATTTTTTTTEKPMKKVYRLLLHVNTEWNAINIHKRTERERARERERWRARDRRTEIEIENVHLVSINQSNRNGNNFIHFVEANKKRAERRCNEIEMRLRMCDCGMVVWFEFLGLSLSHALLSLLLHFSPSLFVSTVILWAHAFCIALIILTANNAQLLHWLRASSSSSSSLLRGFFLFTHFIPFWFGLQQQQW